MCNNAVQKQISTFCTNEYEPNVSTPCFMKEQVKHGFYAMFYEGAGGGDTQHTLKSQNYGRGGSLTSLVLDGFPIR